LRSRDLVNPDISEDLDDSKAMYKTLSFNELVGTAVVGIVPALHAGAELNWFGEDDN
jgi:hypothetical protein